MSNYPAGTPAKIKANGIEAWGMATGKDGWIYFHLAPDNQEVCYTGYTGSRPVVITDVRPQVSLDPDSEVVKEFLTRHAPGTSAAYLCTYGKEIANLMRKMVTPLTPRIEQPDPWSTVVVKRASGDTYYTRMPDDEHVAEWVPLNSLGTQKRFKWSELDDPELVAEPKTQEPEETPF